MDREELDRDELKSYLRDRMAIQVDREFYKMVLESMQYLRAQKPKLKAKKEHIEQYDFYRTIGTEGGVNMKRTWPTGAVNEHLDAIEKKFDVTVLLAVESGSRAWGFESPDSDFDIRFIYVHRPGWYLQVESGSRDVIEKMDYPVDYPLDFQGWDIRKALGLALKGNPHLFEWLRSPFVYREYGDENWKSRYLTQLRDLSRYAFNPKVALYAYVHMGRNNFKDYVQADHVSLKRYLYVIRTILCCMYIEEYAPPSQFNHLQAPPVQFNHLVGIVKRLPANIKLTIDYILEKKAETREMGLHPRIDELNQWLGEQIAYYSDLATCYNGYRAIEPVLLSQYLIRLIHSIYGGFNLSKWRSNDPNI